MIWVEWDSGYKNCYCYDERRNDIKPVNEQRRLVDDLIAVGCKVKRGKYNHSSYIIVTKVVSIL